MCPADYGYDARVEVTCTGGMAQVGEIGPRGFTYVSATDSHQRHAVFPSWRDRFAAAYAREMIEFIGVIDGEPVRVGLADGARAVALTIAGTVSILERRTVELASLDPDELPAWQSAGGVLA